MKTSPFRQRFIESLTLKGYSARTIETYVSVVAQLARYYHRSPAELSDQQVRDYLYHLHTQGPAPFVDPEHRERFLSVSLAFILLFAGVCDAGIAQKYLDVVGGVNYVLDAPFTSSGIGSNSYDFNGTSHYILVTDNDGFTPNAFSVCYWSFPDTAPAAGTPVAKGTGSANCGNYGWATFNNTVNNYFYVCDGEGDRIGRRAANIVQTGKWHHYCATISDASATGTSANIDIYVDGAVVDDNDYNSGTFGGITNNASNVTIDYTQEDFTQSGETYDVIFGRSGQDFVFRQ